MQPCFRNERGVYLVFISLLLVAFFGVAALAVDVAVVTLNQARIKRAADAALAAGMGFRADRGWGYFRNMQLPPSGGIPSVNEDRETELVQLVANVAVLNLNPGASANPATCGSGTSARPCFRSSDGNITVEARYSSNQDFLSISIFNRVLLFFTPVVGRFGFCSSIDSQTGECLLSIEESSEIAPANVALVVDTSGSMNCPNNAAVSEDDSCACRRVGTCATGPGSNSRIETLRESLRDFVSYFNPRRDVLSIIPFNVRAEPFSTSPVATFWARDISGQLAPFGVGPARPIGANPPINGPDPRYQELYQRITNLSGAGNTNPSDGLYAARSDFQGLAATGTPFYVVLFTDGPPTAGTFRFVTPQQNMRTNLAFSYTGPPPAGGPPGQAIRSSVRLDPNNLVTQFSMEWRVGTDFVVGPSPLIRADQVAYGGGAPSAATPLRCGALANGATRAQLQANFPNAMRDGAADCLNNFAFYRDRDFPDQRFISNFPITCLNPNPENPNWDIEECAHSTPDLTQFNTSAAFSAPDNFNSSPDNFPMYYMQNFYHATIDVADNLRGAGATIFSIGLGPPGLPQDGSDPYHRVWDSFRNKSIFLRRVSADLFRIWLTSDITFARTSLGATNTRGYSGYSALPVGNPLQMSVDQPWGQFVEVNRPEKLRAAFNGVAREILMRIR